MRIKSLIPVLAVFFMTSCGTTAATDNNDGQSDLNNTSHTGFQPDAEHPDYECVVNDDCGKSGYFCYNHRCYPDGAIVIKQKTLPTAQAENYYDLQLEALNGTEPYEWLITGALPEGLSYDKIGHITGTPTLASVGSYSLRISVFDTNNKQTSSIFTLDVTEPAVYIATTELPQGQLETEYSAQLEAAYGTAPFQWRLHSGALPNGLTLNSDGTISGIPTEVGTFSFTVKVFDSADPINAATRNFELYVEPQPLNIKAGLYTFDLGTINSALAGYSVTVLTPYVSGAYSATLGATGGIPPYSWALDSNAIVGLALSLLGFPVGLPEGLTLDASGNISGSTTAEAGSFTIPNTEITLEGYLFMAAVTDSEGQKASGIFLIPIVDLASIWDLIKGLGGISF